MPVSICETPGAFLQGRVDSSKLKRPKLDCGLVFHKCGRRATNLTINHTFIEWIYNVFSHNKDSKTRSYEVIL